MNELVGGQMDRTLLDGWVFGCESEQVSERVNRWLDTRLDG